MSNITVSQRFINFVKTTCMKGRVASVEVRYDSLMSTVQIGGIQVDAFFRKTIGCIPDDVKEIIKNHQQSITDDIKKSLALNHTI
jgi:hypothetical protein